MYTLDLVAEQREPGSPLVFLVVVGRSRASFFFKITFPVKIERHLQSPGSKKKIGGFTGNPSVK